MRAQQKRAAAKQTAARQVLRRRPSGASRYPRRLPAHRRLRGACFALSCAADQAPKLAFSAGGGAPAAGCAGHAGARIGPRRPVRPCRLGGPYMAAGARTPRCRGRAASGPAAGAPRRRALSPEPYGNRPGRLPAAGMRPGRRRCGAPAVPAHNKTKTEWTLVHLYFSSLRPALQAQDYLQNPVPVGGARIAGYRPVQARAAAVPPLGARRLY